VIIALLIVKKYPKMLFIDFSWTIDVVNAHAPYHVTLGVSIALSVIKKYPKMLFIDFSWTIDVVNAHAPYHVTLG